MEICATITALILLEMILIDCRCKGYFFRKDKFFKEYISELNMANRKPVRTRGKIKFSNYFQELKKGDNVAVVREPAVQSSFPKRLQGRTGVVESQRGKSYVVKIKDQTMEKTFLIEPVHLKKIKS